MNLKQAENNLEQLIQDYKLSKKISVAIVKEWILNDEGDSVMDALNRFMKKWSKYFNSINDIDKSNQILNTFQDAWNYFPHNSLNGKSPDQKARDYHKSENPRKKVNVGKMPDVVVGNHKMSWSAYETMLKEMECAQVPFKKWIDWLLPEYLSHLENLYKEKTIEKHFDVAEVYFRRVLHVGFVNFNQIPPDFIQIEFPLWWQTHIMYSSLTENEVLSSLKKLYTYVYETNSDSKELD